jgi:hypothetical protein
MFHRVLALILIVLATFSLAGSLTAQEATAEPEATEVVMPTVEIPTVEPTVSANGGNYPGAHC